MWWAPTVTDTKIKRQTSTFAVWRVKLRLRVYFSCFLKLFVCDSTEPQLIRYRETRKTKKFAPWRRNKYVELLGKNSEIHSNCFCFPAWGRSRRHLHLRKHTTCGKFQRGRKETNWQNSQSPVKLRPACVDRQMSFFFFNLENLSEPKTLEKASYLGTGVLQSLYSRFYRNIVRNIRFQGRNAGICKIFGRKTVFVFFFLISVNNIWDFNK